MLEVVFLWTRARYKSRFIHKGVKIKYLIRAAKYVIISFVVNTVVRCG